MGKKGKGKVTGTPEVVKFKGTRSFECLKKIMSENEGLCFVVEWTDRDQIDDLSFNKHCGFLHALSVVAALPELTQHDKTYRFRYHHKFVTPEPQRDPCGYSGETLKDAVAAAHHKKPKFNGVGFNLPDDVKERGREFQEACDQKFTQLASFISEQVNCDFTKPSLKSFWKDLDKELTEFDTMWRNFEEGHTKAMLEIYNEVFAPFELLVEVEKKLTLAEQMFDMQLKQQYEEEFAQGAFALCKQLYPERAELPSPEGVVKCSEAGLFYDLKLEEKHVHASRHVIKEYFELRLGIAKMAPTSGSEDATRLNPQLLENNRVCRLILNFHATAVDSQESWGVISKLPELPGIKVNKWMTKELLQSEVERMQADLSCSAKGAPGEGA